MYFSASGSRDKRKRDEDLIEQGKNGSLYDFKDGGPFAAMCESSPRTKN
jgi:hypothetical protein